jgi:hypothetical protein
MFVISRADGASDLLEDDIFRKEKNPSWLGDGVATFHSAPRSSWN